MRESFVVAVFFVLIWYGFFRQYTSQATETMAGTAMYICDGGKSINAFFYEKKSSIYLDQTGAPIPQGKVEIALNDGRSLSLPQTVSSDGLLYISSDNVFSFWTNGKRALLSEKNIANTYTGCVRIANQLPGTGLSRVYVDNKVGFSLRLPDSDISHQDGYIANTQYEYGSPSKDKKIIGTSFNIPNSKIENTNLSRETYISVESVSTDESCVASSFFDKQRVTDLQLTEKSTEYSVGSLIEIKGDVRYEQIVYAISGTRPCVGVRYFIAENVQTGNVKMFDKSALLAEFDQIRHSLIVAQ